MMQLYIYIYITLQNRSSAPTYTVYIYSYGIGRGDWTILHEGVPTNQHKWYGKNGVGQHIGGSP